MIFEWLGREGIIILEWLLFSTLAGVAALPLCLRLFSALPDRGYTLARATGILLVAFVYWLLGSYGLLRNQVEGIVLVWFVVLGVSIAVYARGGAGFAVREYWRQNRWIVIASEVLFVVLLVAMAIYRIHQNDTQYTEKPMELAFISGVMRSETFPPVDPWMAGYSISYYHFGYIMAGMLSMLSGISSGSGFSMTIALWFALTGVTVFGIGANLVRSRLREQAIERSAPAVAVGLVAAVFVLLLGNLQVALIEMPYQARSLPVSYFDFWATQERAEFSNTPDQPFQQSYQFRLSTPFAEPERWLGSGWWWFRASRVLTDYELNGDLPPDYHAQPIDEFPAFSFVLSDAHPHVLALPFVALAIACALNIVAGDAIRREQLLLYGIVIGGLIFLNTWDGPIYLAGLTGAEVLRRVMLARGRLSWSDVRASGGFALGLVAIAIVAYLPFLIGFRSQAAGFLPNLVYPTMPQHLFLMFAPLMIPVFGLLLLEAWRATRSKNMNWALGVQSAGVILLALVGAMLLLVVLSSNVESLRAAVQGFIDRQGGWQTVQPLLLQRRLETAPTALTLLLGIVIVIGRLFARRSADHADATYSAATGFSLLLVGIGFTLILVPEFIYLRDNFSTRINTVFKFYYQAWIVLAIAGAYGVYVLLHAVERPALPARIAFASIVGVFSVAGLLYPVFAFYTRGWLETGHASGTGAQLTLDGTSRMPLSLTDYQAVLCLSERVTGADAVVAEAVQSAYRSYYGRVGSITGIPIVIGWENHERQWRGATYDQVAGSRAQDVNQLFSDLRWDVAVEIIERYGIDYIFFGDTERQQYGSAGEEKFTENLEIVCEAGTTRVYRVGEDLIVNRE
jgi:YYY domain-containing protein